MLWRIKRRTFERSRIHVVAPSMWIAGMARESPLLGRFEISVSPYGLDTRVFRPMRMEAAREVLNIAGGRKVILFSADFVSERRKGGSVLRAAIERLAADGLRGATLLVVGGGGERWPPDVPFETRRMGRVANDELMAALYSAADVFVLPTLADNLPNGLVESMACGTPCVTFDVGGCPEAVRHMETGYVARPGDAEDLARGIDLLLSDAGLRKRMADAGRKVVEREFTLDLQARRFVNLYDELLRPRHEEIETARGLDGR
jgi:glycosyltransferase involved in cell wall biosynthesis